MSTMDSSKYLIFHNFNTYIKLDLTNSMSYVGFKTRSGMRLTYIYLRLYNNLQ